MCAGSYPITSAKSSKSFSKQNESFRKIYPGHICWYPWVLVHGLSQLQWVSAVSARCYRSTQHAICVNQLAYNNIGTNHASPSQRSAILQTCVACLIEYVGYITFVEGRIIPVFLKRNYLIIREVKLDSILFIWTNSCISKGLLFFLRTIQWAFFSYFCQYFPTLLLFPLALLWSLLCFPNQ